MSGSLTTSLAPSCENFTVAVPLHQEEICQGNIKYTVYCIYIFQKFKMHAEKYLIFKNKNNINGSDL
jgi:hypothetical protein